MNFQLVGKVGDQELFLKADVLEFDEDRGILKIVQS